MAAKHEYVNTSEGSPIRIGTSKYKVLEFISLHGEEGVRYTDIVKYIVEVLKGETYSSKHHRGYWATNLIYPSVPRNRRYGKDRSRPILYTYCEKNEEGKWVLTDELLIDHFTNPKRDKLAQIRKAARKYLRMDLRFI